MTTGASSRLFLLFALGGDRYVLDAAEVVEVVRLRPLKQLPGAPVWVAGVFRHRGISVPVVDLAARAGLPSSLHRTGTRIVLVNYCRPPAPDALLGLILEQATDTLRCVDADFHDAGVDNHGHPYLGPVMAHPLGLVQRVTVRGLLPDDVQARLFPAEGEG